MGSFTLTQTPYAKFAYLYPTANGCNLDCFPFGDAPNWKCVDDAYDALDNDETYVFMDGASVVTDTYVMENQGSLSGTINYIKGCCRAKSDKFPPAFDASYKVLISSDSGCTLFAKSYNMPLSTGFTTFEYAWKENPFTAGDWVWAELDALQLGFEASSPSVLVSPFVLLPVFDGDRTDITDVTTGYEHWDAVRAENPLTQVSEDGAAWKYDLYQYSMANAAYYTTTVYDINKFGDYLVSTDALNGDTYIYAWRDGGLNQYLDVVNVGGYKVVSDGTYYYVGGIDNIYVLQYNSSTQVLSVKQTVALGGGSDVQDLVYSDGFLYAATDADGLRIYSVTSGTLALVDSNADVSIGVTIDDNYVYDTGNAELRAYSFDGTTLVEIDNIGIANIQYQLACDNAGNIFVPVGVDGLKAYSFDGINLALDDTIDDGGTYIRVTYATGYIHVGDAANPTEGIRAYTYTGGALALVGTYLNVDDPIRGIGVDGDFIFTRGVDGTGIILTFNGTTYALIHDTQNGMMSDYLDDNIVSVTVIAKMGKEYDADDEADIRGRMAIKTGGVEFQSGYWTLEYPQRWYAYTWTENPDTVAPWTLAEVKALQAGIGLYGDGTKYAACAVCQILIAATTSVSPQIQTSQCYFKVNYTPDEVTCTLEKPEEVSTDHNRINNIINFWSGERVVYGISRESKRMLLAGKAFRTLSGSTPCEQIDCIKELGLNGSPVNVANLNPDFFNGEFRIYSIGWKKVLGNPATFEWFIELEDAVDEWL